jgi:predicted nuclease of predicted toxin-antitoxin system
VRLLIDGCLSPATVERLLDAGHDVEWVGNWPTDPGDVDVLHAAHEARRVLVTIDRGFGALTTYERRGHSGLIVIRKALSIDHASIVVRAIATHEQELLRGALIFATPHKFRVRWPRPTA